MKVKGVAIPSVLSYKYSSHIYWNTQCQNECLEQFVLLVLTILCLTEWVV